MRFTDYYAEASCTAGRANFITGELPILTGMTTVGQPGADVGLPAEASTIATALKSMGYATAQFVLVLLSDGPGHPKSDQSAQLGPQLCDGRGRGNRSAALG
jgi:arylsulfatase A-like enzyme